MSSWYLLIPLGLVALAGLLLLAAAVLGSLPDIARERSGRREAWD